MNKYIAKDNERLDSVVYRFYGSLEYFSMVLEVNPKLTPLLKNGDVVNLPIIEKPTNKEEALW
ncbi:phage tail protein, partial [Helicobacter valdiviensis]